MKQKLMIWTIFGMLLVMLSSMAFAAPEVEVGDVLLSRSVERSNSELYGNRDLLDDSRELSYATFEIPVKVTNGTINVTEVGISIPSNFNYNFASPLDASYRYEIVTSLPLTITNDTKNIEVKVLVPKDLSAIDSLFNEIQYDVTASLKIDNGTDVSTKTSKLSFNVDNNLELRRANVLVGDRTYRCLVRDNRLDLDCDRELNELEPGTDFVLELEIRNLFRSASRIDFEDVDIDIFDDRDVEADRTSYSERRLRAGDDITLKIDFRVDSRVEDGDRANIEFTAIGIDTNQARHGFKYNFEVRFELPRAKVEIENLRLSRTSVCPGDSLVLTYTIENQGRDRQRTLQTQITQTTFGWDFIEPRFELDGVDRGRIDSKDFSKNLVVPSNANRGDYQIRAEVFYQDDRNRQTSLFETITLRVNDCAPEQPEEDKKDDSKGETGTITIGDDDKDEEKVTQPTPTDKVVTAQPRQNDTLFIVGMVVLIVLLLAVIASMVVVLKRK